MKETYKVLATAAETLNRMDQKNSYYTWWIETLDKAINNLPHGSGFDGKWTANYKKGKLILTHSQFAFMDSNGFYDLYRDLTFIVSPSLLFDFDIKVKGIPAKYKPAYENYIIDSVHTGLREIID